MQRVDKRESLEQRMSKYLRDGEPLDAEGTTKHMQIVQTVQYLATVSQGLTSLSRQGLFPFYVRANQVLAQVHIMPPSVSERYI